MIATLPDVPHHNPRGGARGGRGIIVCGGELIAAGYHTLYRFDADPRERGRITHSLFVNLHELSHQNDRIWAACPTIDAAIAVDGRRLPGMSVFDARLGRSGGRYGRFTNTHV
jgi:hypothetical protein